MFRLRFLTISESLRRRSVIRYTIRHWVGCGNTGSDVALAVYLVSLRALSAGGCIDEHADDGPVPEPDYVARVDGVEHVPGLLRGDSWSLSLGNLVPRAPDGAGRVQDDGMPNHEAVEKLPDGCEV